MNNTIEKVSAFITRETAAGRELLVFAHPDPLAGIQVPAGTVDPDEAPGHAVLRETWEESGLSAVRIVQSLPAFTIDLPAGCYALIQPTTYRQAPAPDAPAQDIGLGRGTIMPRGSYLSLQRFLGEWAQVTCEQDNPPLQSVFTTGWLPVHLLASRLQRTLYHLEILEPTPETWEHLAEDRYLFRYSWLPLVPRPRLGEGQDLWLDQIYERLL